MEPWATNHDGYLRPPVPEVICLFESIAGEHRQHDAVAVFMFRGFLKVFSWPLCEQNVGLKLAFGLIHHSSS